MSSLKTRLSKLESKVSHNVEALRIARFVVDPGDLDPVGYRCDDGTEIIRQLGESPDALRNRCTGATTWPDFNFGHIFQPIYATCRKQNSTTA